MPLKCFVRRNAHRPVRWSDPSHTLSSAEATPTEAQCQSRHHPSADPLQRHHRSPQGAGETADLSDVEQSDFNLKVMAVIFLSLLDFIVFWFSEAKPVKCHILTPISSITATKCRVAEILYFLLFKNLTKPAVTSPKTQWTRQMYFWWLIEIHKYIIFRDPFQSTLQQSAAIKEQLEIVSCPLGFHLPWKGSAAHANIAVPALPDK